MISIIVPIHNESNILRPNIAKIKQEMDKLRTSYEIIIAEDGSTDASLSIARKIASKKIRVLSSQHRLGRGASLNRAIGAAKGEIILYMDADIATNLKYIKSLISEIKHGSDIATGSRLISGSKVYRRSFLREFFSRGYNFLLRLLFKTSIHDHQCGFKAFRKSAVVPLLPLIDDKHWFWDSELLIKAQQKNLKVSEIPIEWTDRKNSTVILQNDIIYMGFSALSLRLKIWFSA